VVDSLVDSLVVVVVGMVEDSLVVDTLKILKWDYVQFN
jgi:hypothetical protein